MSFLAGVDPRKIVRAYGITGKKGAGKTFAAEVVQTHFNQTKPNWRTNIVPCADLLKEVCALLLGWTREKALADDSKSVAVPALHTSAKIVKKCVELFVEDEYSPDTYVLLYDLTHKQLGEKIVASVMAVTAASDELCETHYMVRGTTYGRLLQLLGTEGFRTYIHQEVFAVHVYIKAVASETQILIMPDMRFFEEMKLVMLLGGKMVRVHNETETRENDGRATTHVSETGLDGVEMHTVENKMDSSFGLAVLEWLGTE